MKGFGLDVDRMDNIARDIMCKFTEMVFGDVVEYARKSYRGRGRDYAMFVLGNMAMVDILSRVDGINPPAKE